MPSTNYFNTFIEVADDCKATGGVAPPVKGEKKTVANYEYEMVFGNPCKYTSDDVIFTVYAIRNKIPKARWSKERELYFSKGRPCFRASPLCKTYGWGVHSDEKGRIAIVGTGSAEYRKFSSDKTLEKTKAMRSKRD